MIIGFTGTQRGMTRYQMEFLRMLLREHFDIAKSNVFIHGSCIGADEQAHRIVRNLNDPLGIDLFYTARFLGPHYYIWALPSNIPEKRANCDADRTEEPAPPLERNKIIVRQCQRLIACPGESYEITRSGTWSTIRLAKKLDKPVDIIYPSDEIQRRIDGR